MEKVEFEKALTQDDDGSTIYVAPHEIWNVIEVKFPDGYFDDKPAPLHVYIGIEFPPEVR